MMLSDTCNQKPFIKKGFWFASGLSEIARTAELLFAHLFGFGTLHVQSAGAEREFIIRNVADPHKLKNLIYRLHAEAIEEPQKVHIAGEYERRASK